MPPSLLVSPRARGCTVRRFPERLAVDGSSPLVRGGRSAGLPGSECGGFIHSLMSGSSNGSERNAHACQLKSSASDTVLAASGHPATPTHLGWPCSQAERSLRDRTHPTSRYARGLISCSDLWPPALPQSGDRAVRASGREALSLILASPPHRPSSSAAAVSECRRLPGQRARRADGAGPRRPAGGAQAPDGGRRSCRRSSPEAESSHSPS